VLDFLKVYLVDVLSIHIQSRSETKKKEEAALAFNAALTSGGDGSALESQCD